MNWCKIIEIAAIRIKNGTIVERFSSLVKPKEFPIPASVSDFAGITNDMLREAPSINDIILRFDSFTEDSI